MRKRIHNNTNIYEKNILYAYNRNETYEDCPGGYVTTTAPPLFISISYTLLDSLIYALSHVPFYDDTQTY